jgi:Flp pilus assembly protein TadG
VRGVPNIWRDQRGNAAIIFGLAIIPLLALGGGAVDLAYRSKVRGELQSAADTAAIAAARSVQQSSSDEGEDWDERKAEAEGKATEMLDTAFVNLGAARPATNVEVTPETVRISLRSDVPTSFLGVIGINKLHASGLAEVKLPDPTLVEIALVLDYSGSMRDNDKYIRMTAAARNFVQKVGDDRADRSKIGIVPFSEYVYATLRGGYIRDTESGIVNTPTTACLLNRGYPYSASGETPLAGTPESRWPQADPASPKCQAYGAGDLKVRDLSNDFDALDSALAAMEPAGLTNIALAAEMGWHVLSPDMPFDTARPYSEVKVEKIMILLTDGMQTVKADGPTGENSTLAADDVTAEICTNAKAENIRIYSIAFDIDEERIANLLRGCASDAGNYYDARESADIAGVFDSIYEQISETVWLSK